MNQDFFPQGVAKGAAFLGREHESNLLRANIEQGHHTLLLAPRRYGKTSLARNVLKNLKLPYGEVNFYLTRTAVAVERKFRHCIQEAIGENSGKSDLVFKGLKNFFAQTKKKWKFGFVGMVGVELTPEDESEFAENIFTGLSLLDSTMETLGKKIVLFLDELQEIDLLNDGKQIQGAIREFAQQSKHVVFIFSGSNRRLLQHMFDDQSMPLYELCERIKLHRIDAQSYIEYINNVAQKTYQKELSPETLN